MKKSIIIETLQEKKYCNSDINSYNASTKRV